MARRPEDDDPLAFEEKPTLGSRLMDILAAGARGYGEGAGDSNIPEAAFARSFSGGYEGGKKSRKESRLNRALETYRASDEYSGLGPAEKAAYRVSPEDFLKERGVKRSETGGIMGRLSDLNPSIDPKLDREIRLTEGQAMAVQARKDRLAMADEARKSREDLAREREKGKEDERNERQVERFKTDLVKTGVPDATSVMKSIFEVMPPKGQNIPGIGFFEGSVGARLQPTKEGRIFRTRLQKLLNIQLKDQSGVAVTPKEFERFKEQYAVGGFRTEAEFRDSLEQALASLSRETRTIYGGFPAIARDTYKSQGGVDFLSELEGIGGGGGSSDVPSQSQTGTYGDTDKEARYQAWKKANGK